MSDATTSVAIETNLDLVIEVQGTGERLEICSQFRRPIHGYVYEQVVVVGPDPEIASAYEQDYKKTMSAIKKVGERAELPVEGLCGENAVELLGNKIEDLRDLTAAMRLSDDERWALEAAMLALSRLGWTQPMEILSRRLTMDEKEVPFE